MSESACANGYVESFNGESRGELLNREILAILLEAEVLTADWRKEYRGRSGRSAHCTTNHQLLKPKCWRL
jgi:hypothetical protein